MRWLFILFATAFSFLSANAQKCDGVKEGTFKIPGDDVNPNESILTRTAKHQFEEIKSMGLKLQFDLKWTSDCTYELSNPKVLKGDFPAVESHILYVKIIKVTSSYYTAEITANFADFKLVKDIQIVK